MPIALDAELLRAFVAVVDHRGFTSAARSLNRTQSAVSMQIKRLEAATAAPLFERAGRAVRLTRSGEALLGYARRILDLNDEALRRIDGARLAGTVRLGVIDDYACFVLPAVLARFAEQHPDVYVEVHTGLTDHLLAQLGDRLDLVLGMQPAGLGRGEVLRRDPPVWAGPKGQATHRRDPLPLALYPQGCLFRDWALRALDAAGRRWRLAYMSPSRAAVEAAAAAGLAVTVVKASLLPAGLRRLGAADGFPPLPEAEITLHRAPGHPLRAATALGDFVRAELRG
ncbi:MAG: LysR family transcriptional regulator [Alphaproteobacteria bacterium]|nr:LysR family transcriptional regulator [Alphaproteobacteria bacterium]